MSDIMRPNPFEGLLARILGEYKACRSIFKDECQYRMIVERKGAILPPA